MAKKTVFVSFDYEKDKRYKFLLQAWDAHPSFDFQFHDKSSGEIKTEDIARVKAGLTTKINQADYTLVIIGEDANKPHPDQKEIGYINWQNFEVAKSKESNNKLVGVKISSNFASPLELIGCQAVLAKSFEQSKIIEALEKA